jgi:hypothetical protein
MRLTLWTRVCTADMLALDEHDGCVDNGLRVVVTGRTPEARERLVARLLGHDQRSPGGSALCGCGGEGRSHEVLPDLWAIACVRCGASVASGSPLAAWVAWEKAMGPRLLEV